MGATLSGKLADPAFRRKRAKKARAAQTTVDYHIRKLVDSAPELTAEQRDTIVTALRPSDSGGRAA